ncbi:MAG TPA: two-component regulator propeller domain-containing protein [Bacteroidia bacterium]|nr:two-component regulator propeller domain-containing protein [Bacteroidia bacterium]
MILLFRRMLPVLLAGSIFFNSSAPAQPAWTIYNNVNSPLLINTIRCITIDSQNRKWIGTDWGLAIYDDVNWTIDTIGNSGLPDNNIRCITFDPSGNAWLGTFNSGAVKYDGTTWTIYSSSNSGLPNDFVKGIAFDTAGNPWFATADGLATYDGSIWKVWNMSNSPLLSTNIACIAVGSNDMKYLGTFNGGFYNFDGDTTWQAFSHIDNTLPDNTVLSIAFDSVGSRWLAMPAQGIIALDDVAPPQWSSTTNSLIPTDAIVHIMVDSLQKKYLCSQDEGFIIYDGTFFTKYNSFNSPMPDDYTLCTAKDHNGILWVGTYNGGLVRVDELLLAVENAAEEISSFTIYPNPASKQLAISNWQLAMNKIEVYDFNGRQVIIQEHPEKHSQQIIVDVSFLSPGIYFLRIFSDSGSETRKFVKVQ